MTLALRLFNFILFKLTSKQNCLPSVLFLLSYFLSFSLCLFEISGNVQQQRDYLQSISPNQVQMKCWKSCIDLQTFFFSVFTCDVMLGHSNSPCKKIKGGLQLEDGEKHHALTVAWEIATIMPWNHPFVTTTHWRDRKGCPLLDIVYEENSL